MKPKIAAMQALIAYTALRALRLATLIGILLLLLTLALLWTLAYYLSPWWWVFAVPLGIVAGGALVVRFVVMRTIHLIHRHPFTEPQRRALESFTSKLLRVAEQTGTPAWLYVFYILRDMLRHQDLKTVRDMIQDTTDLKQEFTALEKYFGER